MNRRLWLQRTATVGAGLLVAPCLSGQPRVPLARSASPTIYLDANENPYGPSPRAREAMREALAGGNRYPDTGPLLDGLAETLGVTREYLVLGHGSFELLCTAASAFAGREVVTPYPSFNVIADRAERAGANVRYVPLTDAHALDLDAMEAAITRETDLVYVCNPNNPTGTIVPDRELRPFVQRASESALVVVDEAYHEYVQSPAYASLVDLVREGREVVLLRTFSKIYGLAGMRVGYAVARPDLAARLRAHSVGVLNAAGLAAALASLGDEGFVRTSRLRNAEARAVLIGHLRANAMPYAESHGSFVWARTPGPFVRLRQSLARQDILIGDGPTPESRWGRISLGTPDEMERLGAALSASL